MTSCLYDLAIDNLTRSGDSTARLWQLRDSGSCDSPLVLPHEPVGPASQECNRDVTTVHWNVRVSEDVIILHNFLNVAFVDRLSGYIVAPKGIFILYFCLVEVSYK